MRALAGRGARVALDDLESGRREAARAALLQLQAGGTLSRNAADILTRTLAG